MELTTDTVTFIERLKLPMDYAHSLIGHGYNTVQDFAGIDGDILQNIGITLPGHRKRIMNNLRRLLSSDTFNLTPKKPIAEPRTQIDEPSPPKPRDRVSKQQALEITQPEIAPIYETGDFEFNAFLRDRALLSRGEESITDETYQFPGNNSPQISQPQRLLENDQSQHAFNQEDQRKNFYPQNDTNDNLPLLPSNDYSLQPTLVNENKALEISSAQQQPTEKPTRTLQSTQFMKIFQQELNRKLAQPPEKPNRRPREQELSTDNGPVPIKSNETNSFIDENYKTAEYNSKVQQESVYETTFIPPTLVPTQEKQEFHSAYELEAPNKYDTFSRSKSNESTSKPLPDPPEDTSYPHGYDSFDRNKNLKGQNIIEKFNQLSVEEEEIYQVPNDEAIYDTPPRPSLSDCSPTVEYDTLPDRSKASPNKSEITNNVLIDVTACDGQVNRDEYGSLNLNDISDIKKPTLDSSSSENPYDSFQEYRKLQSSPTQISAEEPVFQYSYQQNNPRYSPTAGYQSNGFPYQDSTDHYQVAKHPIPLSVTDEDTTSSRDSPSHNNEHYQSLKSPDPFQTTGQQTKQFKRDYHDEMGEYNILQRTVRKASPDISNTDVLEAYDVPPPLVPEITNDSDNVYHEADASRYRDDEDEYSNSNDLLFRDQTPAITAPIDVGEPTYEDTSFQDNKNRREVSFAKPLRSKLVSIGDKFSPSKSNDSSSTNDSENRFPRRRTSGISFYQGFPGPRRRKETQRVKRNRNVERPVSVCMTPDNSSLAPSTTNRDRTKSSTLDRGTYKILTVKESESELFLQASDQPANRPTLSPLKKTRTKSGWLWKQAVRDSKVPARKRWAVFDGKELSYYESETKMDFSHGILPVNMMLKLHVPTDNQTFFHLTMKGGKVFVFHTDNSEERVMWTSILMAAILTKEKDGQSQLDPGGDMARPYKEGLLKMEGVKHKVYVALKKDKAAYYKSRNDFVFAQPVTRIQLCNATMRDTGKCKFQLVFPTRVLGFTAESDDEKISWMEALQMGIQGRLTEQQSGGRSGQSKRQSVSLRDNLFKYGGDFKASGDTKKMKNRLNMIKSALQAGEFQKRLCVLEFGVVKYCDPERPFAVKDSFSCSELVSVTVHTPEQASKSGYEFCFELSRKSGRTYLFCAENKDVLVRWTKGIVREMVPDNVYDLLPSDELLDKVGKVKMKVEPYTDLNSGWMDSWCCLTAKKVHFYYDSSKDAIDLDLRKVSEITVNKTPDSSPFDYSILPARDPGQTIVLNFGDKFYFIQSETRADTESWYNAIRRSDCGSGTSLEDMQLTSEGIPIIVEKCLSYVERHGLDARGIYRLSGTHSKTTQLLNSFQHNARETSMIDNINVHDVSNAIKRWCKQMPGSILTSKLYGQWIEVAGSDPSNINYKLSRYKQLIADLPERHRLTLKAILTHLVKVSTYERENDMTLHNLAIVFGPTLMSSIDGEGAVADTAKQIGCIEDLLIHYNTLFEAKDFNRTPSPQPLIRLEGFSQDEFEDDEDVYQSIDETFNFPSSSRC